MIRVYGWKPDRPDFRDEVFEGMTSQAVLPPAYSLRSRMPAPYDQGELGSCTANALGGALAFTMLKEKRLTQQAANTSNGTPSRLFIYYNERAIEGTINQDSGAMIRDGIKTLNKQGACFENIWPYSISQFARRPSVIAYRTALQGVVKAYQRIDVKNHISKKTALVTKNAPIVFGISVYESFESETVTHTGLVPMPAKTDSVLGGHAMLIIGYDDNKIINGTMGAYEVRNSWGSSWGDNGHCYIPYSYLDNPNLCEDNWILLDV